MPPTLADVPALPTIDLMAVELCRVGAWNGRPYTAAEFDEAARTAAELRDTYHIPLKLGHDASQRLLQKDGYPSIGWVENVRRVGNALVGDLKRVPAKLAQLIKSGAYRERSCEFSLGASYGGKERPFMLSAVSLLGADAPAVEGMSDMVALYNARATAPLAAVPARQTVTLTHKGGAPMPNMARILAALPDATAAAFLDWKRKHPSRADLISGPAMSDIQSAVEKALQQAYPPAKGDSEDAPGEDGPSCNILDWFVSGDTKSVIVSDQDVDNLFEIPFDYDPGADTATLKSPIPVKGTYTAAAPGAGESGDAAPEDGQTPAEGDAAGDGEPPADGTQMSRTQLAAQVADSAVEALVAEANSDFQKLLDKVNSIATGKPGVSEFRAMLDAAQKALGRIKVAKPATPATGDAPAAQTANNSREGTDVKLEELARRIGLPATATEAEINARLAGTFATPPAPELPATVATLSRTVETLQRERDEARLEQALATAAKAGRLTKPMREEMLQLARDTSVDTAIRVVEKLPVVVDFGERGRDGDAPNSLAGQLSPNAVTFLSRRYGQDFVESLSDQRSLAEKRDAMQAELEKERQQARLARRA